MRQNDLATGGIVGLGDWVVHDADSSDDLASLSDLIQGVAGVANDQWSLSFFLTTLDTTNFSSVEKDLINFGIQHVSSTVDGAQSTERLWETSETVNWVQEG